MTIFYYYVLQYVGVAASASVFVLQFISLYLHADSVEEDQKRPLSIRIMAYLVHVLVLNVAFFASVCLFRSYWHLIDVYFIFPG